jgi:single-strand DNA-binding protein
MENNKVWVLLAGRVGKQPQVKFTSSGKKVAKFGLATDTWNVAGKSVAWFTVIGWEEWADFVEKELAKGSPICVNGKIANREWVDRDGKTRVEVEVTASAIHKIEKQTKPATSPASQTDVDNSDIPF